MPGPGELCRYVNVPPPAGPPGFRPGFCPLQVCINGYPSGPPTGSRPKALCYSTLCIAPPVVAARAQASRPILQAAAAYIYFISLIVCILYKLCIASGYTPPFSCASIRLLVRPAILLSPSSCRCVRASVWGLPRSGLTSSLSSTFHLSRSR